MAVVFRTLPEVGLNAPEITLAKVDFPEPDGPIQNRKTSIMIYQDEHFT